MIDYVIELFYPEIQQNFPDRTERNVAFFREVRTRVTLIDTDRGWLEAHERPMLHFAAESSGILS